MSETKKENVEKEKKKKKKIEEQLSETKLEIYIF